MKYYMDSYYLAKYNKGISENIPLTLSPFWRDKREDKKKDVFRDACKQILICISCLQLLPSAYLFSQNINQTNIKCPGGVNVNSYNGNMNMQRNDLFISGRKFDLDMTFYYNSFDCRKNVGFGNGWRLKNLMQYTTDSTGVNIIQANGRVDHYTGDTTTNVFAAPTGVFDSLSRYQPGKYVLITKHKLKYFFDSPQHKRLTRMEEPNGNAMTFTYTDSLVTEITDASGRSLQLSYAAGKLSMITDALGTPVRTIQYSYDGNGNLQEVTDPAGNKTKYTYIINGPLNTVTDKNENVVDIIYQSNFAVIEVISCLTDQRISYNAAAHSTYLVETVEGGNQVTFFEYDNKGNLKKKTGNCCGFNMSFEYDNKNNMANLTDANGYKTEFTYDGNGNVLSKKDPLGNTSYYTYEPVFDKVTSYTNRNGNTTTYSYDNKGNIIQASYPLGVSNLYSYASNGDMISTTNGNGNTITYNYNSNGNLVAVNRPLGANKSMTYDARSRRTVNTDELGNTTTFGFNVLNRITSVTDALNNSLTVTYDANSNITAITDRNQHTTILNYDALNRPVAIIDALNHSTQLVYNAKNKIVSLTDANGNVTKYGYDKVNRLISKTNAANEIQSYDYDGGSNIVFMGFPNGNGINITYDALNRTTQATDNIGLIFSRTYDNIGNILSQSDANGNSWTFAYDALSRRIIKTDPIGKSMQYMYDNVFNMLNYTDRNNKQHTYSYDALNRIINYSDALNHSTVYAYDLASNMTSVTDANNNSTTYSYNALNRNTIQTFADGTTHVFAYDANGNIVSRTDNSGATTNYLYDNSNRLTTRDFPGSNDDVYTYDAVGRILTAINNNATVTFSYDAINRLISETLNGKTTSYSYNTAANKRTLTYPGGRSLVKSVDARKRLTEIKEGNTVLASFNYDAANRMLSKDYPVNGTTTNYSYDANSRVISMITNPGGILNFQYGYDDEGNKLFERKLHKPDHSEQYGYDDEYELTHFKLGVLSGNTIPTPLNQSQYNYDALGNRTSITEDAVTTNYTVNNMNAYTNISVVTSVNQQYDNNGNLINDGNFVYEYDTQNRLMLVNGGVVASYQYDALGRRIRKTVGNSVSDFLYSAFHEIENRDSAGTIKASFVFGRGIDNILSAKINNTDLFYYKNAIGSVGAVANNSGAVVERYEYDAFGKIKFFNDNYNSVSNSGLNNPVYFTGRTFDSEIVKYFYRARQYDQKNGRFTQRDPLKYIDGMNIYTYVRNRSTKSKDPFGLAENTDCDKDLPSAYMDSFGEGAGNYSNATGVGGVLAEANAFEAEEGVSRWVDAAGSNSDGGYSAGGSGGSGPAAAAANAKTAKSLAKAADFLGKVASGVDAFTAGFTLGDDPTLGHAIDLGLVFAGTLYAPLGLGLIPVGLILDDASGQSIGEALEDVLIPNTYDSDGNLIPPANDISPGASGGCGRVF